MPPDLTNLGMFGAPKRKIHVVGNWGPIESRSSFLFQGAQREPRGVLEKKIFVWGA
jgi:hypothetical protein